MPLSNAMSSSTAACMLALRSARLPTAHGPAGGRAGGRRAPARSSRRCPWPPWRTRPPGPPRPRPPARPRAPSRPGSAPRAARSPPPGPAARARRPSARRAPARRSAWAVRVSAGRPAAAHCALGRARPSAHGMPPGSATSAGRDVSGQALHGPLLHRSDLRARGLAHAHHACAACRARARRAAREDARGARPGCRPA